MIFLMGSSELFGQIYSQVTAYDDAEEETENTLLPETSDDTIFKMNENEATVAVSEDNQFVLNYKDEKGNGNLYISVLNENKWSIPEKLNKIVNNEGWEPNEYISADGNWLYFTSKRAGGFGGKDIYRSEKMSDGEWSEASNLGPEINTKYDEEAPVLLPDGNTLYFSSNGHMDNGRFNVFKSSLSGAGFWSEPVNVGYPVNKIDEETFNNISANSIKMPQLSFVDTTDHEKENCILSFKNNKGDSFILINGKIDGSDGKIPDETKITLTDNETEKIISYYNVNNKTGHFSFMLPSGKNMNITFYSDGYLFQSENIDLLWKNTCFRKMEHIQMPVMLIGSKIILKNIFFDAGKSLPLAFSNVELNNLVNMLNNNPNLIAEISDYMIYPNNIKTNKIISHKRAEAVVKYLTEKCINENRLSAKGYVKFKSKRLNKKTTLGNRKPSEWIELNIIQTK